jgi:hypothetical protein
MGTEDEITGRLPQLLVATVGALQQLRRCCHRRVAPAPAAACSVDSADFVVAATVATLSAAGLVAATPTPALLLLRDCPSPTCILASTAATTTTAGCQQPPLPLFLQL